VSEPGAINRGTSPEYGEHQTLADCGGSGHVCGTDRGMMMEGHYQSSVAERYLSSQGELKSLKKERVM
jgi:hypothetical protein